MRFYLTHLIGLVVVVATVLAIIQHPEALWAAVVPLVGGVFVVVPVLGMAEWLTPSSSSPAELSWGGVVAATIVALVGSFAGIAVLMMLLAAFD